MFSTPAFLDWAKKNVVLVSLDFPRGDEAKAKIPNPERNNELQQKYGIRGFPTVLLMTPDGEIFGRTGYRPGGPEKYLENLNSIDADWKTASEMMAAWEKADSAAKKDLMVKACAAMSKFESAIAAAKIKEIVVAAYAADPENKDGLCLMAVTALLKSNQASPDIAAAGKKLDPKNEQGLLDLVVQSQFQSVTDQASAEAAVAALAAMNGIPFKDKKIGFGLYFTATRWNAGPLKNPEAAAKFAELAIACGSEDEKQIEFLKDLIAKSKASGDEVEEEDDSDEPEDSEESEDEDEDEEEDDDESAEG